MYATLRNRLTSAAAVGINVTVTERHGIAVRHPAHLTLTRAHVWGWYVNSRSCKTKMKYRITQKIIECLKPLTVYIGNVSCTFCYNNGLSKLG